VRGRSCRVSVGGVVKKDGGGDFAGEGRLFRNNRIDANVPDVGMEGVCVLSRNVCVGSRDALVRVRVKARGPRASRCDKLLLNGRFADTMVAALMPDATDGGRVGAKASWEL
jgi:hypothetical protein